MALTHLCRVIGEAHLLARNSLGLDVVFTGHAIALTFVDDAANIVRVDLDVQEGFKGDIRSRQSVYMIGAPRPAPSSATVSADGSVTVIGSASLESCDSVDFRLGRDYLVFGYANASRRERLPLPDDVLVTRSNSDPRVNRRSGEADAGNI